MEIEYKLLQVTSESNTEERLNDLAGKGYRIVSTVTKGYNAYIILERHKLLELGEK